MNPILIGLTGGIGSGKSTVASELASLGAEVIVGDDLGRAVVEESLELLGHIRRRFGDAIFDPSGRLIRRELGKRIFQSHEDVKWLTDLTFPGIHAKWRDAVAKSHSEVIVFDAALIFEWKIESEFDLVLVVVADAETTIERALHGGHFTQQEISSRLAGQVDTVVKQKQADVVITNNSSLEDLKVQVHRFWNETAIPLLQHRRNRIERST